MTGWLVPQPGSYTEPNERMRRALKCPRCGLHGTIRPTRHADPANFALTISCAGSDNSPPCGSFGVFTPPQPQWAGATPELAAQILQQWINEQVLGGAVDQLGALARKDKEIEELRTELAQIANMVHLAYHREANGSWRSCPTGVCARVQHTLKIQREPA